MADPSATVDLAALAAGDAETIARLAQEGVAPHEVIIGDDDPQARPVAHYFGHFGSRLIHTEELEARLPHPTRKRGTVKVDTPHALTTYAQRHIHHTRTTIWAEIDAGRITVILNDHAEEYDQAGWADHRAALQLRRSGEWQDWTHIAGEWVTQGQLAVFLEEHLQDVADPDGSTLLEITETFHATASSTFTSTKRLADGTQTLVWREDVNATGGRGQQATIPTDLTVRLRPWIGVEPVEVPGKFRFRVRDGELRLRVDLLRIAEASREAVEDAAAVVADELGLPPIEGTPPSPRL